MRRTLSRVPLLRLGTVVVLTLAFVWALRGGRTIDAVVIGVVAIPSVVLLAMYCVAWTKGLVDDSESAQ